MVRVVVVGGGWSGCAAAWTAAKAGADVLLLERTDLLLGTGLVGGIFRNNGRYTAAEEIIALGGGAIIHGMDSVARHKNISFPGHEHASLYDVNLIEPVIKSILLQQGVTIRMQTRVTDVARYGRKIHQVMADGGEVITGEVFIDATGTAGPMGNCLTYGNGCAMCVLRCPSYGPRVSLTAKAQVKERMGQKADGSFGAMSGSCKLQKDSLAPDVRAKLEASGVALLPMPERLREKITLGKKACTQYAIPEYQATLVLLDTGHAKMMTSYFDLADLRTIPGLELARFADPYAGGRGNSVRYLGMAPCDNTLKVTGMDNLFCAGEKSGIMVGHSEAILTGLLSGHNAVRHCLDMEYLELPRTLAAGDYIAYVHEKMDQLQSLTVRYTFSGAEYFTRMKELSLYTTDRETIEKRVDQEGMTGIFSKCLI